VPGMRHGEGPVGLDQIVGQEVEADHIGVVAALLPEGGGELGEPPHPYPHRKVQPLDHVVLNTARIVLARCRWPFDRRLAIHAADWIPSQVPQSRTLACEASPGEATSQSNLHPGNATERRVEPLEADRNRGDGADQGPPLRGRGQWPGREPGPLRLQTCDS
jgi:hypothetical protein